MDQLFFLQANIMVPGIDFPLTMNYRAAEQQNSGAVEQK